MAFPSDTTRRTLSAGLQRAQSTAGNTKRIAANNHARMASGVITAGGLISLLDNLRGAHSELTTVAAMPGIADYAEEQLGVETVTQDFGAMLSAIETAAGWIITHLPRADDGALKMEDMDAQGRRTERSFSTAQTAGLRSALDAVIATID